ncbi:MAG: hypothetical protein U9R56_00830 [candidate division Zixibacteria bacterium]|nr:hypothetical protein [candidate division Zixibacteria bacterium]
MTGIKNILGLTLLLLVFLSGNSVSGPVSGEKTGSTMGEYKKLKIPPEDSAEAERVRIWVPLERQSIRRVRINILNDSNRVIRHLIDKPLPYGYFNYYWDKMDDSGQFVQPGEYKYIIDDLGERRYGHVTAEFKIWENSFTLYPMGEKGDAKVGFELLRDSSQVSIAIINRHKIVIDKPINDSLMNRGKYEYEWEPPRPGYYGKYELRLTVGDFVLTTDIRRFLKKR